MPVTFQVAAHAATSFPATRPRISAPADALESCLSGVPYGGDPRSIDNFNSSTDYSKSSTILRSSLDTDPDLPSLIPAQNGLFSCVLEAYNNHRHLTLRPDDVWLSITTQFSFYLSAHHAELASSLLSSLGSPKRELTVYQDDVFDTAAFALTMSTLLSQHLADPSLRSWLLPSFSTTTHTDTVVGALVMMATLKHYFTYKCRTRCGIPSVTLAGTQADWADIRGRIEKLRGFGTEHRELHAWYELLAPVLDRFVGAFEPGADEAEFWQHVVRWEHQGSGGDRVTGWLAYFVPWTAEGRWVLTWRKGMRCWMTEEEKREERERSEQGWKAYMRMEKEEQDRLRAEEEEKFKRKEPERVAEEAREEAEMKAECGLVPCGFLRMQKYFPSLELVEIPAGLVSVDAKLVPTDQFGKEIDPPLMVGIAAGMIGYRVVGKSDGVEPVPGWWMCLKKDAKQDAAQDAEQGAEMARGRQQRRARKYGWGPWA